MRKMKLEKASFRLCIFLGFAYTMYVIGKMSFSAATVGLIEEGVLSKTETGIISGIFWLIYAMGQIAGAIIINKVSAYLLIEIGIVGSAVSNALMACTENFAFMLVAWCLGAASQMGLWPGILKLTSTEVTDKHRPMIISYLAYAYSIGSIISYFLTAGILAVSTWEYIFLSCGIICAVAMPGIIYSKRRLSPVLEKEFEQETDSDSPKGKLTWRIIWDRGLIFFALLICLTIIVDSGVTSWMPTILFEVYGVSSSYASLLSVVRSVISLLGIALGAFVYARSKGDELRSVLIVMVLLLPMILILNYLSILSVSIVIVLLLGATLLLASVSPRITLNYPVRYQDVGLTATVGGIMNCMSTGGAAIATYGGGYISDHFGWNAVILLWTILIALFLIVAVSLIPIWNRFKRGWIIQRRR